MRIALETMLQIILMSLFCIVLAGMIASNLYILQARDSFYTYREEIEYSENQEKTLSKCEAKAAEKGYRLEYQVLYEDTDKGNNMILLSLYYDLKIPLMKTAYKEGVIQAC